MHKRNMLWLPLTTILVFATLLSACGNQAATRVSSPSQVPATQTSVIRETPVMTESATEPIPATGGIDCMGANPGDSLRLLYPWSGAEEDKLREILKPLVDACGIVLTPQSMADQDSLSALVEAGTPPEIAFGKIAQLIQYQSLLQPMTDLGVDGENYDDTWKDIGTVDGSWLGLPVKVNLKTIIWYSPKHFKTYGYQVPATVDEFISMVDQMASDGHVPFSMGFESGDSSGQLGADFIEDIILVESGAQYVMQIIDGIIPYDSSGVNNAYRVYGRWAANERYSVGGADGTLRTNFKDAIYKVFTDPPGAMMVQQSGSAGGVIAAHYPDLKYGADYDFFQTTGAKGMHGSSSWMMAFSDSAAVKALVAYLSSEQGGQMWAQVGFDVTPNRAGTDAYTEAWLNELAQLLVNGKRFVPDIGEAIPGGFASAERQAVVNFVNGASLTSELSNVAAVQKRAVGK